MVLFLGGGTVDGRTPAPVDRWFIPLFTGCSINSRNKHVYIYIYVYIYIHTPPRKAKHFFRKIRWRLHDSTFVFFFGRGGRLEVKPGSTRWVVATLPKDSLQIGMAKHGERSDASSFKLMIHSCRGLPKPRFRVGRYIISRHFYERKPVFNLSDIYSPDSLTARP